jgi:hypothetical protein
MPRISISDKEFAAISYQTMDVYSEDGESDAGEVHMALKDLNGGSNWQEIDFSNEIAHDTSIFVWEMDVVLGRDNKLYTLSQEQDTVSDELYGNHYNPVTGVLFGDSEMGLVLRGMQVKYDLTVDDEPLSNLPGVPTGVQDVALSSMEGLALKAYPNPFHDEVTIEFSIPESRDVELEIYDIVGRQLCTLIDEGLKRGNHRLRVNVPFSGNQLFVVKLQCNDSTIFQKLICN